MKSYKLIIYLIILLITSILFLNSCDKRVVEVPDFYIQHILATPTMIYPDNDTSTYSEIRVTIADNKNIPIAEQDVTFKILADSSGTFLGNVSSSVKTGEDGIAVAQFHDNGQVGTAVIEASIGDVKHTVNVTICPFPDFYIQNIIASPNILHPDNNTATYSEIDVTVVDSTGVPAPDKNVTFRVIADSLGNYLGNISSVVTSGEDGIATAIFNDNGQIGTAQIEASIDGFSQMVSINIVPVPEPSPITITSLVPVPQTIYADDNEATYSEIKATLEDEDGYPAVGDTVYFRILSSGNVLGSVTASGVSNEFGIAKAQLHDNGITGEVVIEATIMNSVMTTSVSIENVPTYHIASITSNPNYIYADNGITYSEINVVVRDDDNFAVTGEYVQYRTSLGHILYNVLTDSTGVATSTFWDDGNTGTAVIDAFVGDISSSIEVPIYETPSIDSLRLTMPTVARVGEVVEIKATAFDSTGVVADGTIITFETEADFGFFQNSSGEEIGTLAQATTNNGIAKINFNTNETAGTTRISISAQDEFEEKEMVINPGVGRNIYLSADPSTIHVNAGESSDITAIVQDIYGNPVATNVDFTASSGNIPASNTSNENGEATVTFSPGVEAGIIEITAEADSAFASTQVTVVSDQVYSMQFAYSGKIDIDILGTGGQESAEIVVNLYDSNGNLIDDNDSLWVNFKFVNAPLPGVNDIGANINNEIFYPSDEYVSVQPENGQAVVSLSSGTNPGTVQLKAFILDSDSLETIAATKSNIVIHAGPPSSVELSIGDIDSGIDMGGGVWQIECAAIVHDEWGNPVDHFTAVWFSLCSADTVNADPGWATIGAEAYVGNENASGDSTSGVAYTFLNFEGEHTNDSLIVRVELSGLEDETVVTMPPQFIEIQVVCTPSHLDWTEDNNPPYQYSQATITVIDGQSNLINGQSLVVTSNYGFPVLQHGSTEPNYTGITVNGVLEKWLLFYKYECPPPPGTGEPGTRDCSVFVTDSLTGVSGEGAVTLRRYFD